MPLIITCSREEPRVLALGQALGLSTHDIQAPVACNWCSSLEQQEQQWLKAWWLKECRVGRDVGREKDMPQTVTRPKRALAVVCWCC